MTWIYKCIAVENSKAPVTSLDRAHQFVATATKPQTIFKLHFEIDITEMFQTPPYLHSALASRMIEEEVRYLIEYNS